MDGLPVKVIGLRVDATQESYGFKTSVLCAVITRFLILRGEIVDSFVRVINIEIDATRKSCQFLH